MQTKDREVVLEKTYYWYVQIHCTWTIIMYLCMYGHHLTQNMDQPDKVANPSCGQLNRDCFSFLSPFAPETWVSQDRFGRPVPRLNLVLAYSRNSSHVPRRRPFIYTANRHRASPEFIRLRNCVPTAYCREAAGAGPVVFKVVPVTGAAFSGITMDHFLCASLFPHPLSVIVGMCDSQNTVSEAIIIFVHHFKRFQLQPQTQSFHPLLGLSQF